MTLADPWQWQVYMTIVALSVFIIPAIIIAGCYIHIVLTIWKKSKEMGGGANQQQSR